MQLETRTAQWWCCHEHVRSKAFTDTIHLFLLPFLFSERDKRRIFALGLVWHQTMLGPPAASLSGHDWDAEWTSRPQNVIQTTQIPVLSAVWNVHKGNNQLVPEGEFKYCLSTCCAAVLLRYKQIAVSLDTYSCSTCFSWQSYTQNNLGFHQKPPRRASL